MKLLKIYKNKKIIITGHTGFKGSWLSLWFNSLGAKVYGISNNIPTKPSNFEASSKYNLNASHFINICDKKKFKKIIHKIKPDFIFHLAAQSLVKKSYKEPFLTFNSNSLGTLNLLDILKETNFKKKCSVVIITSDKSYRNIEIKRGYVEDDILGGYDPYSASKACAEIIIKSYLESFFKNNKNLRIGIARAGNVIGGGDWSENRLIPDLFRANQNKKSLIIRSPDSTRPWQHVLEALLGYMILGQKLYVSNKFHGEAFNFGPRIRNSISVLQLIKKLNVEIKNLKWKVIQSNKQFESKLLMLNSKKALTKLNWKCVLTTDETLKFVIQWYKYFYDSVDTNMTKISLDQIYLYTKIINERF